MKRAIITTVILMVAGTAALTGANKAIERCDRAAEALTEIMDAGDKSIPQDLLSKAHCVAVVPGLIKGAFIIGGKKGTGVISCRGENRKGWTGPSTIRIEGGSFGLQIGGSKTDVVLLVMNEKGKSKLLSSKFTLGADAAVAGGPVGRTAQAQTDAQMRAEILAYSRSRGVFAGISLEGATLRGDEDEDEDLYGQKVDRKRILAGEIPAPAGAQRLMDTLMKYSSQEHR
jgi:lipid-binding SYLF domain-containing protein